MTSTPTILAVFASTLGYAVIRYHLLKGEPWERFPLYTINKSLAMTGLALMILAAWKTWRGRRPSPERPEISVRTSCARDMGLAGAVCALIHTLASLVLLRPAYFDRMFLDGGKLTGLAELAILAGCCALAVLLVMAVGPPLPNSTLPRRGSRLALSFVLVAVHCVGIGLGTWMAPTSWPGGLPPLTLIGFSLCVIGLLVVRR